MPSNLGTSLNNFSSNNLRSSFQASRPGASLSSSRTPLNHSGRDRTKSALEKIDISKIGKGYQMTEGSYHHSIGLERNTGLKGQLMSIKMAGKRNSTRNLSTHNIEQIHDLLAGAISKSAVSSKTYISREDRMEILRKSRQLTKTPGSKFTLEDRKDLVKIMDTMRKQYRDSLTGGKNDSR